MKCPRCAMAELNEGHCPICHLVIKHRFTARFKKRITISFGDLPRKVWELNWEFYQRSKFFMFFVAIIALGAVFTYLIGSGASWIIGAVSLWFGGMALYEFGKARKARKKEAPQ